MPSDIKDKNKTLQAILKFIDSDFAPEKFTTRVYSGGDGGDGLMYQFGHIAHYNKHGFYAEWFNDDADRLEWLRLVERGGAYGEPNNAIEFRIQAHIREQGLLARYEAHIAAVKEVRERAELARLSAKYGGAN